MIGSSAEFWFGDKTIAIAGGLNFKRSAIWIASTKLDALRQYWRA
jgi:hypothetical protein